MVCGALEQPAKPARSSMALNSAGCAKVLTDRGSTQFLLKGEEDIRRLTGTVLLINDANGVQYMIRDLAAMDKHSRKLLDRFL